MGTVQHQPEHQPELHTEHHTEHTEHSHQRILEQLSTNPNAKTKFFWSTTTETRLKFPKARRRVTRPMTPFVFGSSDALRHHPRTIGLDSFHRMHRILIACGNPTTNTRSCV